jgi:hypothetical protein
LRRRLLLLLLVWLLRVRQGHGGREGALLFASIERVPARLGKRQLLSRVGEAP